MNNPGAEIRAESQRETTGIYKRSFITMQLILSLFTGGGLFDIAFKENGFCVVSAGDIITGPEFSIFNFHAPPSKFDGVIGGSPCQQFSKLNRNRKPEIGVAFLHEFRRVGNGCK